MQGCKFNMEKLKLDTNSKETDKKEFISDKKISSKVKMGSKRKNKK